MTLAAYLGKFNTALKLGRHAGLTWEASLQLSPVQLTKPKLAAWVAQLREQASTAVLKRERFEYETIRQVTLATCRTEFTRDYLGRRAVVLHPGCLTYQHFWLRHQVLFASVHLRSLDERKLTTDLYFLLSLAQELCTVHRVEQLWFQLQVDCYHRYLRATKHPL